jgi:hypothetical protein
LQRRNLSSHPLMFFRFICKPWFYLLSGDLIALIFYAPSSEKETMKTLTSLDYRRRVFVNGRAPSEASEIRAVDQLTELIRKSPWIRSCQDLTHLSISILSSSRVFSFRIYYFFFSTIPSHLFNYSFSYGYDLWFNWALGNVLVSCYLLDLSKSNDHLLGIQIISRI